jgi:NAD(P)-dependent dehydrogenase (short-subunit alcohol dehydrogenase family)
LRLFDLADKVAIITGASRGIGRAIAERMAEAGARVIISSRKQDACESVAAAINQQFADLEPRQSVPALLAKISCRPSCKAPSVGSDASTLLFAMPPRTHTSAHAQHRRRAIPQGSGEQYRCHQLAGHVGNARVGTAGRGSIIIISSVGGLRGVQVAQVGGHEPACVSRAVQAIGLQRDHQCTCIVVDTIAGAACRYAVARMLNDAGVVGHANKSILPISSPLIIVAHNRLGQLRKLTFARAPLRKPP